MAAIKCIGILTSGGDAPGMNAAIRAVTRAAIFNGIRVKGIYRGYKGMITDEIEEFKTQNVSNIIQRGGTILKTARCMEFKTPEGRKQAHDKLVEHGIDSLVVIGGDGGAMGVAERVKNEYPQFDVRVSILGHLQRGGSPTAQDRILATRMGVAAVDALLDGQRNVMIGIQNDHIVNVPFSKAIKNDKPINPDLLNALRISSI